MIHEAAGLALAARDASVTAGAGAAAPADGSIGRATPTSPGLADGGRSAAGDVVAGTSAEAAGFGVAGGIFGAAAALGRDGVAGIGWIDTQRPSHAMWTPA